MILWLLIGCPTSDKESEVVTPLTEECTACGGDCKDASIPAESASHVDVTIAYPDPPPTSGDHNSCWADWGIYTEEVLDEKWVHNLEHGGVVFLYHCPTGCADDVATLTAFVQTLPADRVILSPYSGMSSSFAVVSWQHRLLTGCVDTELFGTWYREHVDQAPERSSSNSGCPEDDTSN